MRLALPRALVLMPLFCAACSSDDTHAAAVTDASTSDKDGGGDGGAALRPRAVTADFLNRSLSVLDLEHLLGGATTRDEALIGTVDLAAYAPGPLEVVVAPDATTALVTVGPGFFAGFIGSLVGAMTEDGGTIDKGGTLLVVDLKTLSVVKELAVPHGPMGIAITPDGKRAFSVDHGDGSGKTMSVIDVPSRMLVESIEVGGAPEEGSVSPDGTLGIVNTDSDESVRFFDPKDPRGTLTAPLLVGADPGGAAFVPSEKKVVIGQSLDLGRGTGKAGYSVLDVSDPAAPSVLEHHDLPGVPYGASLIPGTTRVLAPTSCEIHEIDVGVSPSVVTRVIAMPCAGAHPGLPMSIAVTPDGKHALCGVMGDDSLMVVDLDGGTARRIPWLPKTGPTNVALTP